MAVTQDEILAALRHVTVPGGGNLVDSDMLRALSIEGAQVRFVVEAPTPEIAATLEPTRQAAQDAVTGLAGVENVSVILTAHGPAAPKAPPPDLKIGRHPTPQQ